MPTYQYACTECGHAFEQVQSFTEDSLTVCPQCQGRLRKVYNAVGVVFKGSGFYRNDSRSTSDPGSGSGEKSSSSEGGSGEKSGSGEKKSEPAAGKDSGSAKPAEKKAAAPSTSSSSGSGSSS